MLARNMVRCLYCNTVVESKYPRDFHKCKCGHVSVDGGPYHRERTWDNRKPNWNEVDGRGKESPRSFRFH